MQTFWEVVASNAVLVAVLAAGVALLGRIWKNPWYLHLLWLLVLLKLVTPPLLIIPVASPREARPAPAAHEAADRPTLPTDARASGRESVPIAGDREQRSLADERAIAEAPAASVGDVRPVAERRGMPWLTALGWTWGLGIVLFACCQAGRIFRFRRLLETSMPASPGVLSMADEIARRLALKRTPEIRTLPICVSPLVWSLGARPKVFLPAALFEQLDRAAQEAILAHELAHVRRKDHWVRLLEAAITVLFWWHPVVWWAARQLQELEDQCCDAMVVDLAPGAAKSYATALLDTLDFLCERSTAAPLGATAAKSSLSLTRRIAMLKNRCWTARLTVGRLVLLVTAAAIPMALAFGQRPPETAAKGAGASLDAAKSKSTTEADAKGKPVRPQTGDLSGSRPKRFAPIAPGQPLGISVEKADLMGRVEWAMMHGGRDITARKTIEWGDVEKDADGNRKIRYKFYATIWDKDVYVMNKVFTFDAKGNILDMEDVEGFPQKKVGKPVNVSTQAGMKDLVEDFFTKNFRDVTARETLEWGEVTKDKDGNSSIRYKYRARIWNKATKIINQVFTFDPKGKFVSVKNIEEPASVGTQEGMKELVEDFFTKNFRDVTARESLEWGEVTKDKDGNSSIRHKYRAKIWDKDTKIINQVFTFDPKGKFVSVKDVEELPKKQ